MAKKIIYSIFLMLHVGLIANSQSKKVQQAKNIIYVEMGGTGGLGSINYERIIVQKGLLNIGTRIGMIGYNYFDFTNKFNPDFNFPFSINGFYGQTHKIEFGVGQTITSINHINTTDYTTQRLTNIHANLTIGYRFQKSEGGIVFGINYNPIFDHYKTFRSWGGVSVGYAF